MKKTIIFLMAMVTGSAQALMIDEAGTQRVRKPSVTVSYEVDSSASSPRAALVRLMNSALDNPSSVIVIEADLDGDGELEPYKTSPTKPDTDGDGIADAAAPGWEISRKETSAEAALRTACCTGLATGKRQHMGLDQNQIGVESEEGGVKYNRVVESARVARNRLSVGYEEVSLVYYNPKEVILEKVRKGWDGVVKGSTNKRNANIKIVLQTEDGKPLAEVAMKTKGSGKVEACGKDHLCGKTDHL